VKTYFVIDTNTYLHYQFFTEIKWLEILTTDEAVLLLPMQIICELDDKKFNGADEKIRNRANQVVKRLYSIITNSTETPSEFCIQTLSEPQDFNWSDAGLSNTSNDDKIIASIMSFQKEHSDNNVVLVTSDMGLKLKCFNKIKTIALDDDLKVKKDDKEIRLTRELEKLRNALPKLNMCFQETGNKAMAFEVKPISPLNEEKLSQKIYDKEIALKYVPTPLPQAQGGSKEQKEETNPFAELVKLSSVINSNMAAIFAPKKEEIEEYDRELKKYLTAYRSHWLESYKCYIQKQLTYSVNLKISNVGTTIASHIDIALHFPDGFEIMQECDLPELPDAPTPPRKPGNYRQNFDLLSGIPILPRNPHTFPSLITKQINDPTITIKKTNSYDVAVHIPSLNHHSDYVIDTFYIVFKSIDEIKPFRIDYKIIAGNVPNPVVGKLNVKFS